MHCLSACGPCKEICKVCRESHERYHREARERAIREAVRTLVNAGYKVVPPGVTP
jgi:hypothetical protein